MMAVIFALVTLWAILCGEWVWVVIVAALWFLEAIHEAQYDCCISLKYYDKASKTWKITP